jgi:hypothetical protein
VVIIDLSLWKYRIQQEQGVIQTIRSQWFTTQPELRLVVVGLFHSFATLGHLLGEPDSACDRTNMFVKIVSQSRKYFITAIRHMNQELRVVTIKLQAKLRMGKPQLPL